MKKVNNPGEKGTDSKKFPLFSPPPDKEESQNFKETKEIIKLQGELEEKKAKLKMECLQFERENNRIYHERELERGRIKNAEQRKIMQEKDFLFNSSKR